MTINAKIYPYFIYLGNLGNHAHELAQISRKNRAAKLLALCGVPVSNIVLSSRVHGLAVFYFNEFGRICVILDIVTMVIYPYSLPALIALVAKSGLVIYSRQSRVQNFQTALFLATVTLSIFLSVTELGILQRIGHYLQYGPIAYYVICIPMVALMVHLAISVSFERWRTKRFFILYFLIYGYVLILTILVLFTSLIINGGEDFKGYTILAVRGPFYVLFEAFIILSFLSILALPVWGLKANKEVIRRNQCKLWIAAAAPLSLLVIAVMIMLDAKLRWLSATVTSPVLIASLLGAVGYTVHNHRIIELDFYLPWSRVRKFKTVLHRQIDVLGDSIAACTSLQLLVNRLTEVLDCPVSLISANGRQVFSRIKGKVGVPFPLWRAQKINQVLVSSEADQTHPEAYMLMEKHGIAVIVPFYPHNQKIASWLFLGKPFGQYIYTPQDFRAVERLFDKIAIVLLDNFLETGVQVKVGAEIKAMEECHRKTKERFGTLVFRPGEEGALKAGKPLEDYVIESEIRLIKQALNECGGNKAAAARHLGLKPNTLHYKLKRLGLM